MRILESDRPVAVLYTGGTFGMLSSPDGLVANPDLRAEVTSLVAGIAEVRATGTEVKAPGDVGVGWTYSATETAIDSAEVGPATLGMLSDAIREIIGRDEPRAVVVIHGTDSMAYSSAHVAFALADLDVPVVFTGSQLPLGVEQSDAGSNFAFAFGAALRGVSAGVWIAFDNRIMPAVRATKRSSESFFGFNAVLPIADNAVGLMPGLEGAGSQMSEQLASAVGRETPRVGLVKVSPGLSGNQLTAALDDCPAGIVLECYGAGTAPMVAGELAGPIRRATEQGSVVLAITQCEDGAVELSRYAVGSELAAAGAVSGGDLTTEAALGKLTALARAGFVGDELRELLEANLIGERRG